MDQHVAYFRVAAETARASMTAPARKPEMAAKAAQAAARAPVVQLRNTAGSGGARAMQSAAAKAVGDADWKEF